MDHLELGCIVRVAPASVSMDTGDGGRSIIPTRHISDPTNDTWLRTLRYNRCNKPMLWYPGTRAALVGFRLHAPGVGIAFPC